MTQWYMDNMYDYCRALCHIIDFTTHRFIGAVENNAKSALMWNLALDPQGNPKYPGTSSCKEGCRGVVTIYPDGTWGVNQECMSVKQSKHSTEINIYSLRYGACVQSYYTSRHWRSVWETHKFDSWWQFELGFACKRLCHCTTQCRRLASIFIGCSEL